MTHNDLVSYILPQFVNVYMKEDKDSIINNPLVTMTQKGVIASLLTSLGCGGILKVVRDFSSTGMGTEGDWESRKVTEEWEEEEGI